MSTGDRPVTHTADVERKAASTTERPVPSPGRRAGTGPASPAGSWPQRKWPAMSGGEITFALHAPPLGIEDASSRCPPARGTWPAGTGRLTTGAAGRPALPALRQTERPAAAGARCSLHPSPAARLLQADLSGGCPLQPGQSQLQCPQLGEPWTAVVRLRVG